MWISDASVGVMRLILKCVYRKLWVWLKLDACVFSWHKHGQTGLNELLELVLQEAASPFGNLVHQSPDVNYCLWSVGIKGSWSVFLLLSAALQISARRHGCARQARVGEKVFGRWCFWSHQHVWDQQGGPSRLRQRSPDRPVRGSDPGSAGHHRLQHSDGWVPLSPKNSPTAAFLLTHGGNPAILDHGDSFRTVERRWKQVHVAFCWRLRSLISVPARTS